MALTISNEDRRISGDRVLIDAKVTFDSSYPTGGESLAASDFQGLVQIDGLIVHSANLATYRVIWDETNSKLKVFVENSSGDGSEDEEGNTDNISTLTCLVQVQGK